MGLMKNFTLGFYAYCGVVFLLSCPIRLFLKGTAFLFFLSVAAFGGFCISIMQIGRSPKEKRWVYAGLMLSALIWAILFGAGG